MISRVTQQPIIDWIAGATLTRGFMALVALMLGLLIAGVWRTSGRGTALALAAALGLGLAGTGFLALRGDLFQAEPLPTPLMRCFAGAMVLCLAIGLSPVGRRLAQGTPLWVLVGIHSFRLPLELQLHELVALGLLPEAMTWTGLNLDVITGVSALPVAAWLRRHPSRTLALTWTGMGLVLLGIVLTVAIQTVPGPLQRFEPPNGVVQRVPWVWLPTVLVPSALLGHVLVLRRLIGWRRDAVGGS